MFQRILVPLDGSPLAEKSLDCVEQLGDKFSSEVVLLRVVVPKTVEFQEYAGSVLDEAGDRPEAESYLETAKSRLQRKGLQRVRVIVGQGDAATQIVESARSLDADMIVMTTHGRTGVSRWLYGSVAEKVLRGAPTTVLVLRSTDFPQGSEQQRT